MRGFRFNGVSLVDGTILPWPAALADRFRGYGGGAGPGRPTRPPPTPTRPLDIIAR